MRAFARRLTVLGAALLMAATGVQTAQAASTQDTADCYWRQTRLPMPSGIDYAYVRGSAGTDWIVASGSNYPEPAYGIIWHHQQPRVMLRFRDGAANEPRDINRNGTVVGVKRDASDKPTPYVYQTFYRWLPKPPTGETHATWLNDRGDITGFVDEGGSRRIVLWRAGGTGYEILGDGFPVGIDEAGRVVSVTGEIHHPDGTRGRLQVPAGLTDLTAATYNDGVTAGYATDSVFARVSMVWDTSGSVITTIRNATASVANARGVVLGFDGTSSTFHSADVWRNGVHEAVISDPRPNFPDRPTTQGSGATVTSDDTIIATPAGLPEPSYWRCS